MQRQEFNKFLNTEYSGAERGLTVLRHSFGSYYMGLVEDDNLTAVQMGNSPDMVNKHYKELVTPSQVKAFWGLRKGGGEKKISRPVFG